LYRRLVGPQGQSGQVRKISPPQGFVPRTVQPVAIPTELPGPLASLVISINKRRRISKGKREYSYSKQENREEWNEDRNSVSCSNREVLFTVCVTLVPFVLIVGLRNKLPFIVQTVTKDIPPSFTENSASGVFTVELYQWKLVFPGAYTGKKIMSKHFTDR
jgi:hypothetical protein